LVESARNPKPIFKSLIGLKVVFHKIGPKAALKDVPVNNKEIELIPNFIFQRLIIK
jgi:hypothetical protein